MWMPNVVLPILILPQLNGVSLSHSPFFHLQPQLRRIIRNSLVTPCPYTLPVSIFPFSSVHVWDYAIYSTEYTTRTVWCLIDGARISGEGGSRTRSEYGVNTE